MRIIALVDEDGRRLDGWLAVGTGLSVSGIQNTHIDRYRNPEHALNASRFRIYVEYRTDSGQRRGKHGRASEHALLMV